MSMSLSEFMATKLASSAGADTAEPTAEADVAQPDQAVQAQEQPPAEEEEEEFTSDWDEEEPEPSEEASTEQAEETPADSGEVEQPCCEHPTAFLDYLKQVYGLDVSDKYQNDHEAIAGLVSAYRMVGQKQNDAAIVQYLRSKLGEEGLQRLLEDENVLAAVASAPESQQAQEATEEVEFDPAWLHMVQLNPETNQLEPRPGVPSEVVAKLVRFAQHRENLLNEFAKNPTGFLAQRLGPYIDHVVQQHLNNFTHTARQQAEFQQWIQANAHLLYTKAGDISPFGEKVIQEAVRASKEYGINDPFAALKFGFREAARELSSVPQAKQPAPAAIHTGNRRTKAITPEQAVAKVFEAHKKKGTPISLEAVMRAAGIQSGGE